jgi:hypothetical protein
VPEAAKQEGHRSSDQVDHFIGTDPKVFFFRQSP